MSDRRVNEASRPEEPRRPGPPLRRPRRRRLLDFFEDRVLAAARPEGRAGGLGRDVTLRQAIDAALPAVAQASRPSRSSRRGCGKRWGRPTTTWAIRRGGGAIRGRPAPVCKAPRPRPPRHAQEHGQPGHSYNALGRHAEALKLHEQTLALMKAKLGPDHPDTLRSMNNLATSYYSLGRHAEALKLHEETLALRKAKLGPDHPDTLASMNNLAASYYSLGRHAEALKLCEETLALRKAKLGPDHPDTLLSMNNLAAATTAWAGTPRPSSSTRRRWRCGRRSWAPTTPTRSRA